MVVVGLFSLLLGVIYTGGPFRWPITDWVTFSHSCFWPSCSGGPYYGKHSEWSDVSILAGCAAGLFAVAFLAINNLPRH